MNDQLYKVHEYFNKHQWIKSSYKELVQLGVPLTYCASLDYNEDGRVKRRKHGFDVYKCKTCGHYRLKGKKAPIWIKATFSLADENPFEANI